MPRVRAGVAGPEIAAGRVLRDPVPEARRSHPAYLRHVPQVEQDDRTRRLPLQARLPGVPSGIPRNAGIRANVGIARGRNLDPQ